LRLRVESLSRHHPIRAHPADHPGRVFKDNYRDVDSNRLLRDRDGGLWIGTVEWRLIDVHHGRTDEFSRSDSLSGDVVLGLLEDREGNVWAATTGGLDRFRELPVTTVSVKQGLSSDATQSVLAATDGSIWVSAHDGLTRWKNGLPDDAAQSLFQDDRGRIWVFTRHGLAYFKDDRFFAVNGIPSYNRHVQDGTQVADALALKAR
jgi:ligand-binding sensor domain-containing protein